MKLTRWVSTAGLLLFTVGVALAQPQQSENFRITKSVIDAGGGASSSENFNLVSAFGQPTPIGVQTSENFTLYAGFLSPSFGVATLNPIDDLVIQRVSGPSADVRLAWGAISGAATYNIYRNTNADFAPTPGDLIGSTAGVQFDDIGVVGLAPTQYFYLVTALDGGGALLTRLKDIPKGSHGTQVAGQSTQPEVSPAGEAPAAVSTPESGVQKTTK